MTEKKRRKTSGAISATEEERERLEDENDDLEAVKIEKNNGIVYRIEKK